MKRVLAFLLIALFISVPCLYAANKVYTARETAVIFSDTSPQSFSLINLTVGTATVSEQYDQGAGSTSEYFEWRAILQWDTTPVVGETCLIYIASSDGTSIDGVEDIGTGTINAGAVGRDARLKNMILAGALTVGTPTATIDQVASGIVRIPTRYFHVVVHNDTADALENTNDASSVIITPIPPEVQ